MHPKAMPYFNFYETSGMLHGSISNIMGTRFDALLFVGNEAKAISIWQKVSDEVERLAIMLNRFNPESELAKINRLATKEHVAVSRELFSVLEICCNYSTRSLGYFDITLSDYKQVELDSKSQSVHFHHQNLAIDLGGFAKGYALDQIKAILLANNIKQGFINFGDSSILALGHHPEGEFWPIGVVNPWKKEQTLETINLKDKVLSTSGNHPKNHGHIANPHTGQLLFDKKVVSVVAQSGAESEVLSTALMAAPNDEIALITKNFSVTNNYYIFELT